MHLAYLTSFFADIDFSELMALAIPICSIVLGGVIVVTAMYFKNRRREMWHQTARIALEKGQPLPPSADMEFDPHQIPRPSDPMNDLRAGLVLLGTGIGLFLFLGTFLSRGLGYVGAIPGFIGLGLVLFGLLRMLGRKKHDSDDRLPRA